MKKLAVFDVDGTIFRSSLLIELVNGLIAEGVFARDTKDLYEKAHRDWLDRKGGYEAYIDAVVAAFRKSLKGVRYRDLRRVAYKVVAAQKDRTYRYTRDLARSLRARGYYLVAVSHSPKLAVEGFCKTLGFHKVYGLMYATDRPGPDGRFTGEAMFPETIYKKDKIVRRVVAEAAAAGVGLALRGSVGVGDTESDIPFLSLVDRAVCFNPNAKLYRAARRNGWRVIVERKDVVYEL